MECCFNRGAKCAVLTTMKCDGCHFKKTHRQLTQGRKKARERIKSLPYEQRQRIFLKYHNTYSKKDDGDDWS